MSSQDEQRYKNRISYMAAQLLTEAESRLLNKLFMSGPMRSDDPSLMTTTPTSDLYERGFIADVKSDDKIVMFLTPKGVQLALALGMDEQKFVQGSDRYPNNNVDRKVNRALFTVMEDIDAGMKVTWDMDLELRASDQARDMTIAGELLPKGSKAVLVDGFIKGWRQVMRWPAEVYRRERTL